MRTDFAGRVLAWGKSLRQMQHLAMREAHSSIRVPLSKKLRLWSRGFVSQDWVLYDLEGKDLGDYVSDYARFVHTPKINGRFAAALDNKIVFSRLIASLGAKVPKYFCVISEGRFVPVGTLYRMTDVDSVLEVLEKEGRLVLKPFGGGSGVAVWLLRATDGKLYLNEKEVTRDEIARVLTTANDGVISEFLQQHRYSSEIYPNTTNSMRVQTMWDYDRQVPFVSIAAHRFGSDSTIPVDNWSQGGYICEVDVETGILGKAAPYPHSGPMQWLSHHPVTGAPIENVEVPHWEYVKSGVLDLARRMPFMPYIGWDVVVTEEGFAVTEGNSFTDVHGLQIFRPFLTDARVRRFYEAHRVL